MKVLLRSDHAANSVTARKDNSAMVHCHCRLQTFGAALGQFGTVDKRTTTGWAPVRS
jgi:hypothetical protein